MKQSISIMLTGGGARGAYQAGILWRLSESIGVAGENWKIDNVCGISAGAINASFYASAYGDSRKMKYLGDLWSSLKSNQVFRTDVLSLSRIGTSFLLDTALGPLQRKKMAAALVDTKPLKKTLGHYIDFDRIVTNISTDQLTSLAISAYDYNSDASVCFVQSCLPHAGWSKSHRRSEFAPIGIEQVMASCAIPLIFPPIAYDGRYFADGVLRNTAPLSPCVRLGADKILVVGVEREKDPHAYSYPLGKRPSIATTLGLVLGNMFFDYFEMDIERLEYINRSVAESTSAPFKKVPYFLIRPSRTLTDIARETYKSLPRQIRYLLAGLGDSREVLEVASYLLFESAYTSRLVKLGYNDFKAHEAKFREFIEGES